MTAITLEKIEAEQAKVNQMIAAFKAAALTTYGIPEAHIELKTGELYAGLMLDEAGEPSHHLIALPNEVEDITFTDALAWATTQGGDLPTPNEQSLLFANLKKHFKPEWYWSNREHPTNKGCAFVQLFDDGRQTTSGKYHKFRARAVRRVNV